LCKMGPHGLYLDVIIGAGRARRPKMNLAFKYSESMAITADAVITPLAVPRLPLRSLSPQLSP